HPLRAARHYADRLVAAHRQADGLAAIADQHDLVFLSHREAGNEVAVALVHRHGDDALTATPGDPVLVARGPLAVAVLRDGQDELLGGAHGGIAFLAEFACNHIGFIGAVVLAFALAANRPAHLEIRRTFLGGGVGVVDHCHRDDLVTLGQRNSAHAHGITA